MEIMKLPFVLLSLAGCWRPHSWSTFSTRLIYKVYSLVVICLTHLVIFSQFMDLLMNVDNADEFSDNFYLLLGTLSGNCKMLMLLWNRRNIAILADTFKEGFFSPFDNDEVTLQRKFDAISGTNTLYFFILTEVAMGAIIISSLFSKFPHGEFIFRVWLPYDYYSSILVFILNYIHHGIVLIYVSIQHAACDSLIMGFLIHTCCQLELLGCRLKSIENGSKRSFKKCIKHHEQIYRFADQFNATFRMILLMQFTASMLVFCMNMYQLVKSKGTNGMFFQVMFFLMTTLIQIFLYCWYGNEVKLKSRDVSDAVFEMNWIYFDTDTRRIILTVMQRTVCPIEIFSSYIITMDLETFVNILKASYSAYNMLQEA